MSDENKDKLTELGGSSEKSLGEKEKIQPESDLPVSELGFGSNPLQIPSSQPFKIDESDENILSLKNRVRRETEIPEETSPTTSVDKIKEKLEKDPIFKKLAEPKLPDLPKENRARLQMQSPNRLYFYWSVKNNPFQTLNKAFGGRTGSYSLVAKLKNKTTKTEEIFPVEAEGNWWFNVDSDSSYQAEVGFYAPNRPYVRVMFSNELQTPRRSPSKRTDYTPSFNVNANQFAEVLDVSGYKRDAFEVAITGDDSLAAEKATKETYYRLVRKDTDHLGQDSSDEIRFALLALASGYSLDDIRSEINPGLFDALKSDFAKLSQKEVLGALRENFDIFADEYFVEEETGSAIFGASLVNFPKKFTKRNVPKTLVPKLSKLDNPNPISSFRLK